MAQTLEAMRGSHGSNSNEIRMSMAYVLLAAYALVKGKAIVLFGMQFLSLETKL